MTLEPAIWLTKFVHLSAVALWLGGVLALPLLMVQRSGLEGESLQRLQRMVRFLYVALASPAAFIAIATGTALIFLRGTFVEWFSLKLVCVGALAALHALIGLRVLSVFEHEGQITKPPAVALTVAASAASLAILWLVLAKPDFDASALAGGLMTPGALGEALAPIVDPVISAVTP
jgi:putative membrane protein